jgi:hypothetical protein
MTISPDQAARVARKLYPEEFEQDPTEAIIMALDWWWQVERLIEETNNEAVPAKVIPLKAGSPSGLIKPPPHPASKEEVVKKLAQRVKRSELKIGTVAATIGVNEMSLRNWLSGSYIPNAENLKKIEAYLANG